jgi:hypothetical protein
MHCSAISGTIKEIKVVCKGKKSSTPETVRNEGGGGDSDTDDDRLKQTTVKKHFRDRQRCRK